MARRPSARNPDPDTLLAEAAQFALLRRLAPSLRHRLIGGLHPLSLLAELAGRRLATEPPDLASARDAIAKIQGQARLAATSSIATIAWITGEEPPAVAVKEGIEACVALLRTDSEMRGTEISSQVDDIDLAVGRRALRAVLTAAVVAAVDALPRPARIELRAVMEGDGVAVRIATLALQEPDTPAFTTSDQRPLTWNDVEVIAKLEGVEVRATDAPSVFHCRFRRHEERPGREGSAEPG